MCENYGDECPGLNLVRYASTTGYVKGCSNFTPAQPRIKVMWTCEDCGYTEELGRFVFLDGEDAIRLVCPDCGVIHGSVKTDLVGVEEAVTKTAVAYLTEER